MPVRSQHRGMEQYRAAAPVELRRPAPTRRRDLTGLDKEIVSASDLAVEVARVERGPPDDLVDATKLGHGELIPAECRPECGVLELCTGPGYAILQNPRVVERHAG